MNVKLLTEQHLEFLSLTEGCRDSSESTLVKMPHCSKSHVAAQLLLFAHLRELHEIFSEKGTNDHADTPNEPGSSIRYKLTCAHNEGSNQLAHH